MPVIVEIHYEDSTKEELRLPAEIWCQDAARVSKLILASKPIASLELDPRQETPDIDVRNNFWPRQMSEGRSTLKKPVKEPNPMQPPPKGK